MEPRRLKNLASITLHSPAHATWRPGVHASNIASPHGRGDNCLRAYPKSPSLYSGEGLGEGLLDRLISHAASLTKTEFIMRYLAACLAICLISIAPSASALEFTKDPLPEVRTRIAKKQAVLVDVRSKDEWEKGHVDGAIHVPITALEELGVEKVAKLIPKKKIVYLHCEVGMRAEAAGEILEPQGYQVRVLKQGYKKLLDAGFKKAKKDEDSRQRDAR
jgi:phage shock protein E